MQNYTKLDLLAFNKRIFSSKNSSTNNKLTKDVSSISSLHSPGTVFHFFLFFVLFFIFLVRSDISIISVLANRSYIDCSDSKKSTSIASAGRQTPYYNNCAVWLCDSCRNTNAADYNNKFDLYSYKLCFEYTKA